MSTLKKKIDDHYIKTRIIYIIWEQKEVKLTVKRTLKKLKERYGINISSQKARRLLGELYDKGVLKKCNSKFGII